MGVRLSSSGTASPRTSSWKCSLSRCAWNAASSTYCSYRKNVRGSSSDLCTMYIRQPGSARTTGAISSSNARTCSSSPSLATQVTATACAKSARLYFRVGQHRVGDRSQEIVVRGDEGTQRTERRRVRVEFVDAQAVGLVCALEVREGDSKLLDVDR